MTAHVCEVMGSNPCAVYWMDIFCIDFVVKIVLFCMKRPKINEKEAGLSHFFKKVAYDDWLSPYIGFVSLPFGSCISYIIS